MNRPQDREEVDDVNETKQQFCPKDFIWKKMLRMVRLLWVS